MTEREAKLKWCPFARPASVRPEDCGEVRGNRRMDGTIDTFGTECLGSACMAWRWDRWEQYVSEGAPPPGPDWRKLRDHLSGADWELVGGHCGLAGKP